MTKVTEHAYMKIYYYDCFNNNIGFPHGSDGKEFACNAGDVTDVFDPWVGKVPWRRAWQPTPVFLPGESHGQKSLASYSLWGHEESDMTE